MTMELSAPLVSSESQPKRKPIVGVKFAAACFMMLALSSGVSFIQSSTNVRATLQIHLRESSATTEEKMEEKMAGGEQIVAANEQQIMRNTTFFPAKETSSSFKVAHYRFPSVQERLQYYMGDWYNKSDWTVPDCKLLLTEVTDYKKVFSRNVVLNTTGIKGCVERGEGLILNYCTDAYQLINASLDEADINLWLFNFGDRTYGMEGTLPIIAKARRSALSFHPQPIVWLLNRNRHYKYELENYASRIVKRGKEIPWSDKLSKVFWRGSTTFNKLAGTSRLDVLAQWINYDDNHMDIAFHKVVQMRTNFNREYVKNHYVRKKQSLLEMNRYKYLLSVEGNDVATGLKWMLYSNSVVLMSRPTVATWAMEDLLVPYVHYIPLANDYSNLLEMVKWAEEHDEACQEISKRATEFIEHLWISKQAKKDTKYLQETLVRSYANQFSDPLSKCAGPEIEDVQHMWLASIAPP